MLTPSRFPCRRLLRCPQSSKCLVRQTLVFSSACGPNNLTKSFQLVISDWSHQLSSTRPIENRGNPQEIFLFYKSNRTSIKSAQLRGRKPREFQEMLDELVKQVRRLFSSKNNGGKQVPQLTDRFHTHKQVLMALSLAILLGYSRSRNLFACEAVKGIDLETLTDFCLTNGTSTVISNDADQQVSSVCRFLMMRFSISI